MMKIYRSRWTELLTARKLTMLLNSEEMVFLYRMFWHYTAANYCEWRCRFIVGSSFTTKIYFRKSYALNSPSRERDYRNVALGSVVEHCVRSQCWRLVWEIQEPSCTLLTANGLCARSFADHTVLWLAPPTFRLVVVTPESEKSDHQCAV